MKLRHLTKVAAMPLALLSAQLMANGSAPIQPSGPQGSSSAWSVYAGFGAGYQYQRGSRRDLVATAIGNVVPTLPISTKTNLRDDSPNVTLHLGINWHFNQTFTLGLEPYYSYSSLRSTAGGIGALGILRSNTVKSRSALGLDLKPGLNVGDSGNIFLLLGLESRKYKLDHFSHSNPLGVNIGSSGSANKQLLGYSYGIGYSHTMGKNIVGIRLKHTLFKRKTITARDTSNTNVNASIKPNVFSAMLTYSYKFLG